MENKIKQRLEDCDISVPLRKIVAHPSNVGSRLVKGSSVMLKFSKFIQTSMFEKWVLNNANFFGGPKIFKLET